MEEEIMEEKEISAMLGFIQRSPSEYHVIDNISAALNGAGYVCLPASERWTIEPGGKYYTLRGGSSLIAFRIPAQGAAKGFRLTAAHSDSPSFRIKANAELRDKAYLRVSTEPYGGMIMSSWLDRPLSVAGRVLVRTPEGLKVRLVNINRDLLVIPSVAIHMDRSVNDGKKFNESTDMLPLFGTPEQAGALAKEIAQAAGVEESDVVDGDLFVYCRTRGCRFGAQREFILSPKLDDLACVWSCLRGFLDADDAESGCIPVCCTFHNEEVGSVTKQGAGSTFLCDTLRRISFALGGGEERYQTMLAGSFFVSADNAHAIHPNHPEYADRENAPVLNGGVVIKYNAAQRYATDGVSAAVFRELCRAADVPVQVFANRSDLRGGSTLGSIAGTHMPVPTVDVGMPQLAMHASVETAGAADVGYFTRAMREYFSAAFTLPPEAF